MADNYFIYDNQCGCANVGSVAGNVCLPDVTNCLPTCTDYYLKPCDQLWNDNLCQTDQRYSNPYVNGDKISFQLLEIDNFNPDPMNPADGWGTFVVATLLDHEKVDTGLTLAQFASDYVVGWSGNFSYQTIVIDTALFDVSCWHLQIEVFNSDNNVQATYCSEPFSELPAECPPDTVVLNSTWPCTDCCGYYYGVGS